VKDEVLTFFGKKWKDLTQSRQVPKRNRKEKTFAPMRLLLTALNYSAINHSAKSTSILAGHREIVLPQIVLLLRLSGDCFAE